LPAFPIFGGSSCLILLLLLLLLPGTTNGFTNPQTQNLMMTMLLVSAPIILVMGVLSAFVATGNQAQLMW
jgi:hypothetical protein